MLLIIPTTAAHLTIIHLIRILSIILYIVCMHVAIYWCQGVKSMPLSVCYPGQPTPQTV